jgi:hypothetical protein
VELAAVAPHMIPDLVRWVHSRCIQVTVQNVKLSVHSDQPDFGFARRKRGDDMDTGALRS